MTDRCEPPDHLRGVDGWHWVRSPGPRGIPFPARWWQCGMWDRVPGSPEAAHKSGYRYIAPVTTPAEVEALRAEVMRAGAECADAMAQVVTLRARMEKLATGWVQLAAAFRVNMLRLSPATHDEIGKIIDECMEWPDRSMLTGEP